MKAKDRQLGRPPFRADHVGSLLRPPELHELRQARSPNLKDAEDRAIREVVKLQEDLGLRSITDGEFRRDFWHVDFLAGFDGVTLKREELLVFRDYLSALLAHTEKEIKAGKSREEIQKLENLPGFADFHVPPGRGNRLPGNLGVAYDELMSG